MQVSAAQLEAIRRLARTPDGRVLQSLLIAERAKLDKAWKSTPVDKIERAQGQASAIEEIANLLEDPAGK